jgi:IclR family transcriptional regulator, KDG regulon repressor
MLSTVEKAFQVIQLFTPAEPVWGATAVAARLGLPKSNAHELLQTLVGLSVLRRHASGRYVLGALSLLGAVNAALPWLGPLRWAMYDLAQRTGESIHLSTLQGGALLHLEYAQPQGGSAHAEVAPPRLPPSGVPPQCSAMGKVLLSAWPWPQVLALTGRQVGLTENSITTSDELQTELQRVRDQGYAYDVEEAFPGVCCVAAPIRGSGGELLAALSVSAPSERFYAHKQTWRDQLLQVCGQVSQTLALQPDTAPVPDPSGKAR